MRENQIWVAIACSGLLTTLSQAALVLTVDTTDELLSFSGTTSGNDQELFPGFAVIEWGTSFSPSTDYDLTGILEIDDAPTLFFPPMRIGSGFQLSFQFNSSTTRTFTGVPGTVFNYGSAADKTGLENLIGSTLFLTTGDPSLGDIQVVAGDLTPVPEPGSALLVVVGACACLFRHRRIGTPSRPT